MMTDPISDMFTRIRNKVIISNDKVIIPFSKFKRQIAKVLKEEGFIKNFKIIKIKGKYMLKLYLEYVENNECVIHGIKRVSKPGRRVYASKAKLPSVMNGLGVAILSTSTGLLSDLSCKKKGIGGEVIGYVW